MFHLELVPTVDTAALRDSVWAFALEMEGRLSEFDEKYGGNSWGDSSFFNLEFAARVSINKLYYAYDAASPEDVREHATDAANYLMMIADNWGELLDGCE